jgi:hypothetical protein
LKLPLDRDFFQEIEEDLVSDGRLSPENLKKVYGYLRRIPLLVRAADLRARIEANRDWYVAQLETHKGLGRAAAEAEADRSLPALFDGWREPAFIRSDENGRIVTEEGVPLRAMLAYLYCEEAKNLHLLTHHDASWIEHVSRSQLGDRCFEIDPAALPGGEEMKRPLPWENGLSGPDLLQAWLKRCGARPFDYNKGLDDDSLTRAETGNVQLHLVEGSNFFRGLALIDLIEAMLKRTFGAGAVAVRINAAGQGDFFQIHYDASQAAAADIKDFIEKAVYCRFGLNPEYKFVDVAAGGPAVGVALEQLDELQAVAADIESQAVRIPRRLTE